MRHPLSFRQKVRDYYYRHIYSPDLRKAPVAILASLVALSWMLPRAIRLWAGTWLVVLTPKLSHAPHPLLGLLTFGGLIVLPKWTRWYYGAIVEKYEPVLRKHLVP